jgi:hypothetical protein
VGFRAARAGGEADNAEFLGHSILEGSDGKEPGGKESDYCDWQVAEFQKQNSNVSIKTEFIPSTFEGWAKFDTAVAAGSPPEVMWGQTGNQWKYAPQGAIESSYPALSAIDVDNLSTDVACQGRGQEQEDVGHFYRVGHVAEGNARGHITAEIGPRHSHRPTV